MAAIGQKRTLSTELLRVCLHPKADTHVDNARVLLSIISGHLMFLFELRLSPWLRY